MGKSLTQLYRETLLKIIRNPLILGRFLGQSATLYKSTSSGRSSSLRRIPTPWLSHPKTSGGTGCIARSSAVPKPFPFSTKAQADISICSTCVIQKEAGRKPQNGDYLAAIQLSFQIETQADETVRSELFPHTNN